MAVVDREAEGGGEERDPLRDSLVVCNLVPRLSPHVKIAHALLCARGESPGLTGGTCGGGDTFLFFLVYLSLAGMLYTIFHVRMCTHLAACTCTCTCINNHLIFLEDSAIPTVSQIAPISL